MIWDRWRKSVDEQRKLSPLDPFEDLIEDAPVMTLLLDRDRRVTAANRAAREYFEIDAKRLPASIVEVTLEGKLVDVLRAGRAEGETLLVHRRRYVRTKLVPGPRPGETLMFLLDVTDVRLLERIRQEFVANLVHELKTPITSLRLTAEALEGDPPVKDRRRFAERLVREADMLSKIIDNLRQLAEIESDGLVTEVSTFDVDEMLHEAVRRIGSGRAFNLDVPPGLAASTDRPKLAQALGNLLDNAAKFSPPDSAIDVTAGAVDGELRISVRDRGPGISPEHWSRVFERFYKVDRARPREAGGFGLGLAISKHLVQALGGKIWTEAAAEGGQVFTIALPQSLTRS
ncbi:MAG TPA: PAS domain-containing sensor histidine kinase [Candidatus Dormibacteraeota bacterium]|nr:PAS domain-containing sensor histidine kinase [Candidatus Dormibacteraeota bacterium]